MTESSLPSFVALQPMQRENGYVFTVEPHHCVGPEQSMFLFGGTPLAAGIAALDMSCELRSFGPARSIWVRPTPATSFA